MSVIDDLRNEFNSYAAKYVTVEIVNFALPSNQGPAWNVGDTGSFQVRVTNNGDMLVENLKLHISALNGLGQVRYTRPVAGVPYQSDFVWPIGVIVNPHGSHTFGVFGFIADKRTNGVSSAPGFPWTHI